MSASSVILGEKSNTQRLASQKMQFVKKGNLKVLTLQDGPVFSIYYSASHNALGRNLEVDSSLIHHHDIQEGKVERKGSEISY